MMEFLILHNGAPVDKVQATTHDAAQRHADVTHSWPVVAIDSEAPVTEFVEAVLMSKLKLMPVDQRIDVLAQYAAEAVFNLSDRHSVVGGPMIWKARVHAEVREMIQRALDCSNSVMAAGLREIAAGAHPVGGTAMNAINFEPRRIAMRSLAAAGVK